MSALVHGKVQLVGGQVDQVLHDLEAVHHPRLEERRLAPRRTAEMSLALAGRQGLACIASRALIFRTKATILDPGTISLVDLRDLTVTGP